MATLPADLPTAVERTRMTQPLAAPIPGRTQPERIQMERSYEAAVNPQWLRLLKLLQMNVAYVHCRGTELTTTDGRVILDFLSGYCVHNLGHNHPAILAAVKAEVDRLGPAMLQSHVPERAGELAERLCRLAGGRVRKAFFCSSGSEGVEAAIKFARSHTGRSGLLSACGAFHGLTCGALSLMDDPFWRGNFGTLLPETAQVPFGDLSALETRLKTGHFAAFFLEPIQGEAGIRVPEKSYLSNVAALCRRYGTLLVLDEVQTGFHRTGPFLAAHHYGVTPDMVVLAKAMSGGLVPSAAVLMTDDIYDSVFGSLRRSLIHTSTFSENGLSLRVGLAVLDTCEAERLEQRGRHAGEYLRSRLRSELASFEMVREVRGEGCFSGVEFCAPQGMALRLSYQAFQRIHPAMFGQVLVMRLFRDHGILTQICGNNFQVLKMAPPLTVTEGELDQAIAAVKQVVELAHRPAVFWTEALSLAARVVKI